MRDIEVFILTRNRIELLKESVNSILNQTHRVKLTIIDNFSEDSTQEFIKELSKNNDNIHYFRQSSFVPFEKNFQTAKDMAQADYVMFFHDDDILHPQYIETAFKLINKYENVDVVFSLMTIIHRNEDANLKKIKKPRYCVFKNKTEFVKHVYSAFFTDNSSIIFPSVIYKTCNIKNITFQSELFGKIADKPFVIDSVNDGIIIQIREKCMLNYRVHELSDSSNFQNGPFPNQIINHHKKFRNFLNSDFSDKFLFDSFSFKWLKELYLWSNGRVFDKEEFKRLFVEAFKQDAISPFIYNLYIGKFHHIYIFLDRVVFIFFIFKQKFMRQKKISLER